MKDKNIKKTRRVSLNFPEEMVEKVKKYAQKKGLPDTYAYVNLINRGLSSEEYLDNHPYYLAGLDNDTKFISLTEIEKIEDEARKEI